MVQMNSCGVKQHSVQERTWGRAAHPCQAGSQSDRAGWGPGGREDSTEEQAWSDPSCRVQCPHCAHHISSVVLAKQTAQVTASSRDSCKKSLLEVPAEIS